MTNDKKRTEKKGKKIDQKKEKIDLFHFDREIKIC